LYVHVRQRLRLTTSCCSSLLTAQDRIAAASYRIALPISTAHAAATALAIMLTMLGGSVAEWLASWTQALKGLDSNCSCDAVG